MSNKKLMNKWVTKLFEKEYNSGNLILPCLNYSTYIFLLNQEIPWKRLDILRRISESIFYKHVLPDFGRRDSQSKGIQQINNLILKCNQNKHCIDLAGFKLHLKFIYRKQTAPVTVEHLINLIFLIYSTSKRDQW